MDHLSEEQFQRLSDEQLSPAEFEAIEAHLEKCPLCQGKLNDWMRHSTSQGAQSQNVVRQSADKPYRNYLDRLGEARPPTGAITPEIANGAEGTVPPSPAGESDTEALPNIPGYEIRDVLARGGMGIIYKARHIRLNRIVALKMLLDGKHAGADDLNRFRREAEAVACLQHPNIVQIYEVGEYEGRPYFALEFLDSGNLDKKLDGTPLPARQAAELLELLARAIHVAHERGVIHRDLKPANVLLARSDSKQAVQLGSTPEKAGPYEIKITDFGLAKRLNVGKGQTATGVVMGTPSYMAPEQARGEAKAIGPAADVYALGVILYEALTGRPPFKAESQVETILQVLAEEPVPPSRLQPKVPRDLETICLKCLHKEPGKRYATAEALAEDLARFRAGNPVQARATPFWERVLKLAKRRPATAALVVLSVLVLLGLGIGGALFAEYERGLRRQADDQRERAEQKEQEANRQREIAERILDKAVQAVEDWFTVTNENILLQQPNMLPARKQLLGTALKNYKNLTELRSNDPKMRAVLGRNYFRIGRISIDLGDHVTALAECTESVAILKKLVEDYPQEFKYNCELANSYHNLGYVQYQRRLLPEAVSSHKEALSIWAQLALKYPENPRLQDDLADSHLNLGAVYQAMNRLDEALNSLKKAASIREKLVGINLPETEFQMHLCQTYNDLANAHGRRKQFEKALHYSDRSIKLAREIFQQNPDNLEYCSRLAGSLNDKAVTLEHADRPEEAVTLFHQAIEYQRTVLKKAPLVHDYRQSLHNSCKNLTIVQRRLGRPADAAASALEVRNLWPKDPNRLYSVACHLALCVPLVGKDKTELTPEEQLEQRKYADQAIEVLRQARAAGFGNWKLMNEDKDLESLRKREDFQKLLAELKELPQTGASK
jgi:serine/threonine protein kinase/cell fate (sporulation/competence/biofilm development) regulator YmcA (YheA/YmcA/DUF963 family)